VPSAYRVCYPAVQRLSGGIFAANSKPAARMTARGQAAQGQINPARIEDIRRKEPRPPLPQGEG